MVRHGASHKIKCFKVLLYTRSKAKTRFDFGKDQGLAREREKKRVTPEFGERKEEKFYPQIQGVTGEVCMGPNSNITVGKQFCSFLRCTGQVHQTVRWCTGHATCTSR
jgi:hypothetical protein